METQFGIGDRVRAVGRQPVGKLIELNGDLATVEYDHGHVKTKGQYPVTHLELIEAATPEPDSREGSEGREAGEGKKKKRVVFEFGEPRPRASSSDILGR